MDNKKLEVGQIWRLTHGSSVDYGVITEVKIDEDEAWMFVPKTDSAFYDTVSAMTSSLNTWHKCVSAIDNVDIAIDIARNLDAYSRVNTSGHDRKLQVGQIWRTPSGELFAVTRISEDIDGDLWYDYVLEDGSTDYEIVEQFYCDGDTFISDNFDMFRAMAEMGKLIEERQGV